MWIFNLGKLAPLSSLSPQDKFSVGKQTGDLLGGLKKPGTEVKNYLYLWK